MTRGGARKGAGRPLSDRNGVTVSFWVSSATRERLRALRAHGFNTAPILEQAVEEWYEDMCEELEGRE